ncbi:MAG: bifunctional hydroxymethylpyrimidine kinase/phosphomethylpyrimidine kinase [Chloroflexi bacterium]|nr:bifunctional hydroxymethylpyrimidine kinase/phosphomethylpyrimidine kinase [Chloroflexota bacterium]
MAAERVPRVLTIAGSDSGGGAGIQADLKTFAALGVYGMSAITAVTAQNTLGVTAVQAVSPDVIAAQIDAVVSDIGVDAVKTGMLSNAEIIRVVASKAREHGFERLVVDPVMVATSGARLLRDDAVETLVSDLLPLATVVTPNIPEAEALTGARIADEGAMRHAARAIRSMGPLYVVVKGGHLESSARSVDLLFDGMDFTEFAGDRIDTTSTHGTGCTFASALASGLAHGLAVADAVGLAKRYVTEAMAAAFPVGQGHGPVSHLYGWWRSGDLLRG